MLENPGRDIFCLLLFLPLAIFRNHIFSTTSDIKLKKGVSVAPFYGNMVLPARDEV